jgi:dTDP-4-amino-4,6-dideoxygalactose transaminase
MGEAEAEAARRVILSGWTSQGPEVAAFESEFAAYVGAPYACAVSNCTTALHLALLAAGVGPGDEVITVSHSFIATANSIRYCGGTPVFVDIEPETYNIDPMLIETAITEHTRGILCVHQLGMPCNLEQIVAIASRHNLFVIEDAACAAGSEVLWNGQWERIGKSHADAACFSFHPRKVISTGEGGMITTQHADWDRALRLLRQHAMSVPDTVRHVSSKVVFESYPTIGYNYRMTDIQAAVGREQLKRLPEIVRQRRELATRYGKLLQGIEGLKLPLEPKWARTNWQSYCVELPTGCDQREMMQELLDAGVSTRRGVMCSHRERTYAASAQDSLLMRSQHAQDRCILLPIYPRMRATEQERVTFALRDATRRTASLSQDGISHRCKAPSNDVLRA